MNRLKRVQISAELIHHILSQGTRAADVVSDPLPDDAILVAVNSDGRTVTLTYQSDSFDEVPDGEFIPVLSPMYKAIEATPWSETTFSRN